MTKTIKINELFEKRAKLYPNKVAIINEDKEITYEKLNGMAYFFMNVNKTIL